MNRVAVVCGLSVVVALARVGPSGAADAPASQPAGQVILDEGSYWRALLTCKTPVIRKDGQLLDGATINAPDYGQGGWRADTPWPADGWTRPEFDDSAWGRWRLDRNRRVEYNYGFKVFGAFSPALGGQFLRGRFTVDDPGKVKDLTLSLAYRGGAVVYVNGRQVARGNLPAQAGPDALAEDYPIEAFVRPDGQCIRAEFGDPAKHKDRVGLRIRRLQVDIPGSLLRRGTNVLAIEIHRAPYWGTGLEKENMNHETVWSTCGLADVELTASAGVVPNVARPAGVQVWNVGAMTRLSPADYGEPHESLCVEAASRRFESSGKMPLPRPIRIVAARNGWFCGRVAVSSSGPLRSLNVEVSELRQNPGPSAIPRSAVSLFYTTRDDKMTMRMRTPDGGFWDTLSLSPPAELLPVKTTWGDPGVVQSVWIKLAVPADAAPGEYAGALTLQADGLPRTAVPVHLKVIDYRLPDPADYATHLGLAQSPDSVAIQYKVEPFSPRHWELMDKSFQLMHQLGVKNVYLPMICRTNFGNEQSMVRWVRQPDGSYAHDFSVFDRYMDLACKYLKPDVVCLYVWDRYTGEFHWAGVGERQGKGALVTLVDPATGTCQDLEGPRLGTPEAKAFWEPVFNEVRARLEKRGLLGSAMMGLNGDAYRPTDAMARMFKELMPGARWISNSHGDARGTSVASIPVGYNTVVYLNMFPPPPQWDAKRKAGWRLTSKVDLFPRSAGPATKSALTPTAPLSLHRIITEAAVLANCSGVGRSGMDFWPVLEPKAIRPGVKHSVTITARYPESCWDQLNMDRATEALAAPGPDGAVPTERFENVRQGVQECEARIFIEQAITDPATAGRLGEDLVRRCQQVLDERAWQIRAACMGGWNWYEAVAGEALAERLFAAAAEVAGKLGPK